MKNRLFKSFTLVVAFALAATAAQAACYADYKAKQDNPLKLHYGVIELTDPECVSIEVAAGAIAPRIEVEGWVLLNVLTVFGADGLEQRKESAGEFFLRY